jgi:hypothetical protein
VLPALSRCTQSDEYCGNASAPPPYLWLRACMQIHSHQHRPANNKARALILMRSAASLCFALCLPFLTRGSLSHTISAPGRINLTAASTLRSPVCKLPRGSARSTPSREKELPAMRSTVGKKHPRAAVAGYFLHDASVMGTNECAICTTRCIRMALTVCATQRCWLELLANMSMNNTRATSTVCACNWH